MNRNTKAITGTLEDRNGRASMGDSHSYKVNNRQTNNSVGSTANQRVSLDVTWVGLESHKNAASSSKSSDMMLPLRVLMSELDDLHRQQLTGGPKSIGH